MSGVGSMGAEAGYGVGVSGVGAGAGAGGGAATAAALSLMHALPLHYLPPAALPDHHHWDQPPHHATDKQQAWSKWSH